MRPSDSDLAVPSSLAARRPSEAGRSTVLPGAARFTVWPYASASRPRSVKACQVAHRRTLGHAPAVGDRRGARHAAECMAGGPGRAAIPSPPSAEEGRFERAVERARCILRCTPVESPPGHFCDASELFQKKERHSDARNGGGSPTAASQPGPHCPHRIAPDEGLHGGCQ